MTKLTATPPGRHRADRRRAARSFAGVSVRAGFANTIGTGYGRYISRVGALAVAFEHRRCPCHHPWGGVGYDSSSSVVLKVDLIGVERAIVGVGLGVELGVGGFSSPSTSASADSSSSSSPSTSALATTSVSASESSASESSSTVSDSGPSVVVSSSGGAHTSTFGTGTPEADDHCRGDDHSHGDDAGQQVRHGFVVAGADPQEAEAIVVDHDGSAGRRRRHTVGRGE